MTWCQSGVARQDFFYGRQEIARRWLYECMSDLERTLGSAKERGSRGSISLHYGEQDMQDVKPMPWITREMLSRAESLDQEYEQEQIALSRAQKAYAALGESVRQGDDEKVRALAFCNLMRGYAQASIALKLRQAFNRVLIEKFEAMSGEGQRVPWLDEALRNHDRLSPQLIIWLLATKHDLVFNRSEGEWHPGGVVVPTVMFDDDIPY